MTSLINTASRYPVVFLHGYSGEATSLQEFARFHSGSSAICINLPGFGGSAMPSLAAIADFNIYCEVVWADIRKVAPTGKVVLVGHSYGAMVAFNVAFRHSNDVVSMDLYCPVATPRFAPRAIVGVVHVMSGLRLPLKPLIVLFSQTFMVDLVTRFMLRGDWPPDVKQRIIAMRRGEVRFYSQQMFQIMAQSLGFRSDMDAIRCSVPMRICSVTDDTVAGKHDSEWYKAHGTTTLSVKTHGGHLCVVAEPERLAHIFTAS